MKRTTIILALLATSCARPAYVAKSDAEAAYLHGHISRISESVYTNSTDKLAPPDTLGMTLDTHPVVEYNASGNVTRMESFAGPARTPVASEEYTYDPSGVRLEHSVERNLARHGVTTVLYNYDDAGRLTSEVESNGFFRFDHTYDRHGYPKTRIDNSSDREKPLTLTRYTYDHHGRLKSRKDGIRAKFRYHPDGVVAEIRTGRNSLDRYNSHGNLETMAVRIKRRDQKGRVFERFPVTITATYEYDARGNWVRRVQYFKGEVQSVAVREIDYYEDR
jgi:YD repeat-containing protein